MKHHALAMDHRITALEAPLWMSVRHMLQGTSGMTDIASTCATSKLDVHQLEFPYHQYHYPSSRYRIHHPQQLARTSTAGHKMRSLTLTTIASASTADLVPGGSIGAVAIDPDDGTVYVAHEQVEEEGGVRVEVLAFKAGLGARYEGDVSPQLALRP